jgi:hypothetical protein
MLMGCWFRGAPILAVGTLVLGVSRASAQPATQPPATQPPATQPPATQPPATPSQPADAAGAATPLRVLWTSDDPSCDGGDVAARALRLVSPGVAPSPLTATVEVRHDENWLVQLETESGPQRGRRTLRAESCQEIEQAIALLLAMTMEARGELPGPSEPPPEAPAPAPVPSPAPPPLAAPAPSPAEIGDEEPARRPTPERGIDIGWFARVGGKGGKGLQPGYAWGVSLGLGIRLGDVDVGVEAQHWPATSQRRPEQGTDAEISVGRENVGLRACWDLVRVGRFVAAPCVAPQVTLFRFDSRGLEELGEDSVPPLFGVAAAADARYELLGGRLAALLSLGLEWEQKQPFRVRLQDQAAAGAAEAGASRFVEVYRTTGVGSRLEVGIDARF